MFNMVKVRSYISKKSVPRGIDINDKEYWQPFAITVKGNNSGGNNGQNNNNNNGNNNGNNGNNGNNNGGSQQTAKCNITIITTPADATIRAVDGQGNSYTSKSFQVDKGSQVTVVATPNSSSTGYFETIKVISSQETNQDNLVYNITLDSSNQQRRTTVTVLVNQAGTSVNIFDIDNNNISNGSNIVTNVLIGTIISVSASKDGYVLTSSSHGIRSGSGNNVRFTNITVVENLIINLTLEPNTASEPSIRGVENRYDITGVSQEFERSFLSKFYKIRAYGELPITLSTSSQESSADSFGGHSIINNGEFVEQRVTMHINFVENNTNQSKSYNFTVVAENVQGQQVSTQFSIVQGLVDAVTHKVKIDVYINGVKYSGSDVVRKIEGTFVLADEEIDVVEGSEIDATVEYLGESWTNTRIIAARTTIRFDIDVAYIHLNSCNVLSSNRVLMIDIPSRNVNSVWNDNDIPILFNKQFRITGRVNDNTMLPYDSGWLMANSSNVNSNFERLIDILFTPIINAQGVIIAPVPSDASVVLTKGGATFANGEQFNVGEHVGYRVSKQGYITVDVPWTSEDAIVVGTTPMPFIVSLQQEEQRYTVTLQSNPAGARILLKQNGVDYPNGSSFLPGTWVGYNLVLNGYEIIDVDDADTNNAIYVPQHNYTDTIQMIQAGSDHSISISPDTITIDSSGGQRTIEVTTDANDFTVINENDWISCQKSGNNVFVTINPNTGAQRIGNIDFLVQSQTAQLIVTQTAGQVQHSLSINRHSIQFENDGSVSGNSSYNEVEVTTDAADFQVVGPTPISASDWCTYTREGNVLTFTVDANIGADRSCRFNICVDDIVEEIVINQWGSTSAEFAATEDGFSYANDGETLTVDFNEDGVTKEIYIHTSEHWIVE